MDRLFRNNQHARLILASSSKRRRELLAATGLNFTVLQPDYPEEPPKAGEEPDSYAIRMAVAKARATSIAIPFRDVLITADTVVYLDGKIIGKPENAAAALATLASLRGREHQVYTAVCISCPDSRVITFCEMTRVLMALWPMTTLRAYVATMRPLDKAGSYGIQDAGGFLVERIEGSYTNVLGLPLSPLIRVLLENDYIHPSLSIAR